MFRGRFHVPVGDDVEQFQVIVDRIVQSPFIPDDPQIQRSSRRAVEFLPDLENLIDGIARPVFFRLQEMTEEIVKDMILNLPFADGYSDSKGIFPARKAVMHYCQEKKIPDVQIDDIYLGNGVSDLILMSMEAFLDNGDEVLVPSPDYPLWTAAIRLAGGNAVHYLCDEQSDWYPDIADMESKITPKTKAIVVINPNNPTGAVYPKEVLERIVALAEKYKLALFCDEIYDKILYDGVEHISLASLAPDVFCVTLNGVSKSYRSAGFRAAWMVLSGNKKAVGG